MPYIFSLDIGTSSLKGALINQEGVCIKKSQRFYIAEDLSLIRTSVWHKAFRDVIKELSAYLSQDQIEAIIISSHAPSLIPLDKKDNVIEPPLHHFYPKGESFNTSSFYLSTLNFYKKNFPDNYEECSTFLTVSEYFVFLLTGEKVTASPLYTYNDYFWEKDELVSFGLDINKMAPFFYTGQTIGKTLGKEGEPKGIDVILGGIDYLSSLIGAGAFEEGFITDRAGSSEGLNLCQLEMQENDYFYSLPQLPEGFYNSGVVLRGTGLVLDRIRYGGRSVLSYRESLERVLSADPFYHLYYMTPSPYFWDFNYDAGFFIGSLKEASFSNLARAKLEAILFSMKGLLEEWKKSSFKQREAIRVVGGQSKSSLWNQFKADIIERPLEVPVVLEADLLGNAIIAFVAKGFYKSFKEASPMIKIAQVIEPDSTRRALYREKYEFFKNFKK